MEKYVKTMFVIGFSLIIIFLFKAAMIKDSSVLFYQFDYLLYVGTSFSLFTLGIGLMIFESAAIDSTKIDKNEDFIIY